MSFVGYARVSTEDKNQKLDSQLDQLKQAGCIKIFHESHTGTWDNRPQWKACLDYLRPGDVLVATELSRISRNSLMLMQLGKHFNDKGIELKTLNGFVVDTTTPMGKFFYTVLAGLAQLERDILSERTKAGLAAARARGRNGGRPRVLDDVKKSMLVKLHAEGQYSIEQLANAYNVSHTSVRRFVRESKIKGTYPSGERIIMPTLEQLTGFTKSL